MGTIVPFLNFPRLLVTAKTLSIFKVLKLIAVKSVQPGNIFIDTTPFFTIIDNKFKRESYRRPIVLSKILFYLQQIKAFSSGRKTIFIYYVDTSQFLPENLVERRCWPLIHILRQKESQGRLPFDYVLLALKYGSKILYFVLSNPLQTITTSKFFTIMRSLKTIRTTDDIFNHEEIENSDFSEKISDITKTGEDRDIFIKKSVDRYINNCSSPSGVLGNLMLHIFFELLFKSWRQGFEPRIVCCLG